MFKQVVIDILNDVVGLPHEEIEKLVEVPPSLDMGDYSFPCFVLANPKNYDDMWKDVEKNFFVKKSPVDIATHLAERVNSGKPGVEIDKVESRGPYLNFFVNKERMAREIVRIGNNFGKGKNRGKVLVEFSGPNTNKPLHLGHLRNISIGESISRIQEFYGKKVVRANLNNDRGIHICKSMIAYDKYGKGKTPKSEGVKSDHFVGDYYVLYNQKLKENPELEEEAKECLVKWEKNDKKTVGLWKKMNKWATDGFNKTYNTLDIKFDKVYNESEVYHEGKVIIDDALKKDVFKKREDGAVFIDLGQLGRDNLGEKVLLRPDGTSVYMTQDIALAKQKNKHFDPDLSVYVVGNEQIYHFKVLFEIMEKLGYEKDKFLHLHYGMVNLPEGKMKSREGTIVDADDLIESIKGMAKEGLIKRGKLSKKEIEERSLKIALGALRYFILKIDAEKDMVFNPKESLNFEGNTGPYLQYSYARASSIVRKVGKSGKGRVKIGELTDEEIALMSEIDRFPEIVVKAGEQMNPSLIANYSYELAKTFNEFYHCCKVVGSEEEGFRLRLVESFRICLKNALYLLGIETMEEM